MKPILYLILLISTNLYSQQHHSKVVGSTPKKKISTDSIVTFLKKDTIKIATRDSAQLSIPAKASDSTTIILVSKIEEKDHDLFEYILPIVTLFLGVFLTLLIDTLKARRFTWKTGERWFAEIKNYINIAEAQIPFLQDIIDTEDPNVWGVHELKVASNLDGEIFNAMNKEELLKFLKVEGGLEYTDAVRDSNKLTGTISSMMTDYHNLINSYDAYKKGISRASQHVNEYIREIGGGLATWQNDIQQRQGSNKGEQIALNNAFQLWEAELVNKQHGDNTDIFAVQGQFLEPLIATLYPFRMDNQIMTILNTISKCIHSIKGIRVEKEYLIDIASQLQERYSANVKQLTKTLKETESLKFRKRFYQIWRWG